VQPGMLPGPIGAGLGSWVTTRDHGYMTAHREVNDGRNQPSDEGQEEKKEEEEQEGWLVRIACRGFETSRTNKQLVW